MDIVRWKLKEYLDRHDLSAYALTKTSELASNTIYTIVRGDTNQVRLETLAGLLSGLRKLTGEPVTFADVLEHVPASENEADTSRGEPAPWQSLVGLLKDPAFITSEPGEIDRDLGASLAREHLESLESKR